MAGQSVSRKLAAIFAADMVGYSRLMEADEDATIRTLDTYRQVVEGLVENHRGRVFGSAGDSVIAEFASPVEAVGCAADIQRELEQRNADLPEDRRMDLRIGVNLGDVVVKGDDLLGDGVNVAARLQALAEPGGIYLSGTVFDQVDGKLDLTFDDLGKQEVKNIAKPVRVYRVRIDTPKGATDVPSSEPPPLPDKPSIAVLPFTNMSGDVEQEYFADGIVEEIITALSKIGKLFVVARNSTFTYKGQAVDIKRVGREQGVRYVLEGSVRLGGDRLRITAQLIDAATGHHLWAERYDRESGDVFALQDEITREVVSALQIQLTEGEQARLWASGTRNLEAWELAIRANDLINRHHWEDTHEGRRLLERALRLDENYAAAWSMLGTTHWEDAVNAGWSDSRERSLALALEANDRAHAIDPSGPGTLADRALIQQSLQNHDEALALSQKAVALAPNHSQAAALAALIASYCGEPQDAVDLVEKAIRLCPIYPAWYLVPLCRAYWLMERFEDAINAARSAIERDPDFYYPYVLRVVVYADMGREKEAQRAAADLLRIEPTFSISGWRGRAYGSEIAAREAAALHKLGLPE